MATAVAPKPSAPHLTKMKRPPLPTVQTNGIHSSQSSHSPPTSSKRLPGFKQPPPSVANVGNGDANGLGPRLSNRRKDSQKPMDSQGRPSRSGRGAQDGDRKIVKRMAEPYVKTQSYILKRYRNKPPSLIVHLHPTHFRFDTQDGSFTYNSPMKIFLEHLKALTVPHEMMEELHAAGTKFYEGCLIVQVQDHKSNTRPSSTLTGSDGDDKCMPGSIHNYNQYLTPSPYMSYPKKAEANPNKEVGDGSSEQSGISQAREKEPTKPKTFHIVLFPTQLSTHAEVVIQANTVDPRPNNRKHSAAIPRTPASATVPPTPTSGIPQTPSATGPPAKKQKMSISGNEIHQFESKIIQATAPPLYLDPAEDIMEASEVLQELTDPLHREPCPAPKVKKRTVAELAADEAIAAQEQDFMLIMDEMHASGATGAKGGPTDGENGIPTFQPHFEQFQAIRNIKAEHKERAARQLEEKRIQEAAMHANKLRQDQQERAHKQEMERRAAQVAQDQVHKQNLVRQSQMQKEIQRQALASSQNQLNHGHGHPLPNGISRAQNASPVIRNGTPNANSSPLVGNVPMQVTPSAQGVTSSPARPPSAAQHGQPLGNGMVRQVSRQQAPSRTSTPQLNSTPSMQHRTPVVGQNTGPRVSQGSPSVVMNQTMNHNAMVNPHINGQAANFSPEQLEKRKLAYLHAQRQQQQQQQMQRMQNGSPHPQMSPEQRTALSMQHQAAMNQQRNSTQEYQQQLRMHHAAMGNGPGGSPAMPMQVNPVQQNAQQGHPQQRQLTPQQKQSLQAAMYQCNQSLLTQAAQRYGGNPASIPAGERATLQERARLMAQDYMRKQVHSQQQQRLREQQQQHHQAQLQQQQQHMAALNAMNGMNGHGMQGMNGIGINGMSEQQRAQMMQGMSQMSHLPHLGGNGMMPNQHMNGGMGGM